MAFGNTFLYYDSTNVFAAGIADIGKLRPAKGACGMSANLNNENQLKALEDSIGYRFNDFELLMQAVTHSSYVNELKINKVQDYERLEFLGDAVLELVSSEFLFMRNKELPEGELTKLRASMVCEPSLALCARDLGIGQYLRLGKGEDMNGGRNRESIVSDVMEAVIGAIYIDGGMEPAKDFINKYILADLENKQLQRLI